jgi:hypothetical protein
MLLLIKKGCSWGLFLLACFSAGAQRTYVPNSVLASGRWFKLSVQQTGVYKIDIALLNSMGVNTANISSSSIRLYGNGGQMLAEANATVPNDDLQENALLAMDGGDGVLNGTDMLLFYANGPDQWKKDSANQRFSHQKNSYSDKAFYFLTVGGTGKRIADSPIAGSPNLTVTQSSGRYFHELDTVNFLTSGKEWYGEEFSNLPGRSLTRTFTVNVPNINNGSPLSLQTNFVARSVNTGSRFDIKINNGTATPFSILPVGTSLFDPFAQQVTGVLSTTASQSSIAVNYSYFPGSVNAQGWLNWFELFYRQDISLAGINQLTFRDWASVGNNIAAFVVNGATAATQVWDVTDPQVPLRMQGNLTGTTYRFSNSTNRLREYIAFTGNSFLTPVSEGAVANQNLHSTAATDYIIIVHPPFTEAARRLANFHQQKNGLRTLVVTTAQVYNESTTIWGCFV